MKSCFFAVEMSKLPQSQLSETSSVNMCLCVRVNICHSVCDVIFERADGRGWWRDIKVFISTFIGRKVSFENNKSLPFFFFFAKQA